MICSFRRCLVLLALGWGAACAYGQGAAPFEDSMAQRLLACTGCHGKQGRAGPDGYYPRLAGKPAGYLYNQLHNFQSDRRHYALMVNLLEPLSDAYLREIADYFSALDVPTCPRCARRKPRVCWSADTSWQNRAMQRASCRRARVAMVNR